MKKVQIEDNFADVLSKAARGFGLSISELAKRAKLDPSYVRSVFDGTSTSRRNFDLIADQLGLDANALAAMTEGVAPPEVTLPDSVAHFNTKHPVLGYEAMTVNSYLFAPAEIDEMAIGFDTGAEAGPLLEALSSREKKLSHLFLTHTHTDHVAAFSEIYKLGAKAFCPKEEPFQGCEAVVHKQAFEFGSYRLTALSTRGHSVGGMSYLLEGLEAPIVFVGDAIFCLSMGKANTHFALAKNEIRSKLLSLPSHTILCPGHGPLTTVGFEIAHNPFFA